MSKLLALGTTRLLCHGFKQTCTSIIELYDSFLLSGQTGNYIQYERLCSREQLLVSSIKKLLHEPLIFIVVRGGNVRHVPHSNTCVFGSLLA